MLEGVKRRASMCQAYYRTSYIRERYIVSVSSNFLTQISCGIKTKCRKTRAMQRDFTIVDSLALRQCNTSMIPDTHLLKLLFLARYYPSLNSHPSYIYQHRSAYYGLGCAFLQYTAFTTHPLPFRSIKLKNPYTVDEYSQKLNERKILTVLRRNSIIIVNCSAEYI